MSVTYTTVHGNAGSLTHWAGPRIEPASSWILSQFCYCWATMGTPTSSILKSQIIPVGVKVETSLSCKQRSLEWTINSQYMWCSCCLTSAQEAFVKHPTLPTVHPDLSLICVYIISLKPNRFLFLNWSLLKLIFQPGPHPTSHMSIVNLKMAIKSLEINFLAVNALCFFPQFLEQIKICFH